MLNAQRHERSQKVWSWTDFYTDTTKPTVKPAQTAQQILDTLLRVGTICKG